MSLDAQRQQRNLAFIASGAEFSFGDPARCPLPPAQLAALRPGSPGVEALVSGGLTAEVLRLRLNGQAFAIKKARPQCLVRNADGQTSFLNELQRHAELRALDLPGVLKPVYGSLHHGVVVSRWIDGGNPQRFDPRQTRQLLQTACALAGAGFFEWDYSPGNLLDDGQQLWLFDFGYMYRFDPLSQFNSAGNGRDCPQFHPAERIIGRNLSGQLLGPDPDAALHAFSDFMHEAVAAYGRLHEQLSQRAAEGPVLAWLTALMADWRQCLARDPAGLFMKTCWHAHATDLDDDLRGQTCTPGTLLRADWLVHAATHHHAALRRHGVLSAEEAHLSAADLAAHYAQLAARAQTFMLA